MLYVRYSKLLLLYISCDSYGLDLFLKHTDKAFMSFSCQATEVTLLFYLSYEGCSAVLSRMFAHKILDNFTTSETQKYLIPHKIIIVVDVGIGNKHASRYRRKVEQQAVTNSLISRTKSFEALNTFSMKNECTFLDYVEPSTDQISALETKYPTVVNISNPNNLRPSGVLAQSPARRQSLAPFEYYEYTELCSEGIE
jgi:hypothetical protein